MDILPEKWNEKLEQTSSDSINIFIFTLGIACAFGSMLLPPGKHELKTIILSVGCSLIATSIVSLLTSKYLIRIRKTKELINTWGLKGIYKTRQKMNTSADESFENLENNLDIIAWGLKNFRDGKGDKVLQKVKKGLKVRIIAPHPESKIVIKRAGEEQEVPDQIKNTIIKLERWVQELKDAARNPEDVQLRFYHHLPQEFYFRQDNNIFIGPYRYGMSSQQTISYEFKSPGEGFEDYKSYFEKLWNDPGFCS